MLCEEDAMTEMPTAMLITNQMNGLSTSLATTTTVPKETVVQFKLYNSPVQFWKRRYRDRPFWYKISPMDMSRRESEAFLDNYEGQESTNINELVSDGAIKISVMRDGQCEARGQAQFGHQYDPEEFALFSTNIVDLDTMAFMIDFYVNDGQMPIPEHIGFCYVLPSNLVGTSGSCTMPITGKKHSPIGQISIEYLIIRSVVGYEAGEMNFARLWRPTKPSLDVGHRGAGYARRTDKVENVLENTVASFNYAAAHGADMVELDVQLTKDLVPVIYHDYFINIAMKKKRSAQDHEFLQIPVKDLTLSQLHALKLAPISKPNKQYDFLDDDDQDNQPFPTLEHILDAVDHRCGFNVEIKYPMQRQDGTFDGNWEKLGSYADLNSYVDIILKSVIEHADGREIIFSSFHPDICALVALKQSKYPLLFLTQGETDKWPSYWDPRTRSVQQAAYFAKSMGFLGINVHAEDLLKDRSLIQFVKQRDLILFVWGEDLMDKSIIKQLKIDGVDGVIYDKIDEFHSKEPAFLVSAQENRKTLLNIISSSSSGDMPNIGSSWTAGSSNMSNNSSP
ncbi:Glycerophosphocholine phosphodiesterase GPCPD1 [Halotydeus destructor]|nr:Glycerophosphocholine phosphodiesterase GPCPD1 [Halotydeus destructor]